MALEPNSITLASYKVYCINKVAPCNRLKRGGEQPWLFARHVTTRVAAITAMVTASVALTLAWALSGVILAAAQVLARSAVGHDGRRRSQINKEILLASALPNPSLPLYKLNPFA